MSKSLGNHIGVTESPDEMFGKTMRIPDDAMAAWFALLAVEPPAGGASPRDAKRALARAIVERFHSRRGGRRGRGSASTRSSSRASCPTRSPRSAVAPPNGTVHVPALIADGLRRARAPRPAGCIASGRR